MLGQGGCAFGLLFALVGFGMGFLVGGGVGAAVGRAVGLAVGLGVGFGLGWAVRTGVAAAVGVGVGPPVAVGWLGRAEGPATGAVVGVTGPPGEALATAIDGLGLASGPEGLGAGDPPGEPLGDALGTALDEGWAPGDADEPAVPAGPGVRVEITAIGPLLSLARCWSSKPPRPSAIVARTRFRTPRLRMRRAR